MSESTPVYQQSAVIPYRTQDGSTEILLIRNRSDKRWIIPKGLIEPGMSAPDSARNEALEEAGIEGTVYPEMVGEYEYEKWGGICKVQVYMMQVEKVLDTWLESFRRRKWVSCKKAVELVSENNLKKIISKQNLRH
jgi:8-oxo-dGTP pyrophosphatase MutT (NUDIX family)